MKIFCVLLAGLMVQLAYGHYQGPFLLWGVENLNDMKIPTLQGELLDFSLEMEGKFEDFRKFYESLREIRNFPIFL